MRHRCQPTASDYDWRLYGTVTIDGLTGGLAWKGEGFANATGTSIRELNLWERIDVQNAVATDKPPGVEGAPDFAREQTWGATWARAR